MNSIEMYEIALDLKGKWKVTDINFIADTWEVHVYVSYVDVSDLNKNGWKYRDLDEERVWRHLDTMQYKTFIHCKVPRIKKCNGNEIKTIKTPWAKNFSRFTLMFESFIIELAKNMPVLNVAQHIKENHNKVWRIIFFWVFKARGFEDFSDVKFIGIDETGFKKFHKYITVIVDSEKSKVLCVVNGKDSKTIQDFIEDFELHNGNSSNIELCTCDMSIPFQAGIQKYLPNAKIAIDKFHIFKHVNDALNQVRRDESRDNKTLKKSRFLFLKSPTKLTPKEILKRNDILALNPNTSIAYNVKLELEKIYLESWNSTDAKDRFNNLISIMLTSELEPFIKLAQMFARRMDDICRYFDCKRTNAILEGINSLIQMAKARARGFKNLEYFKSIIYLISSDLNFEKAFNNPMVTKYLHLK